MTEIEAVTAWIGIGSNLDDPVDHVCRALRELSTVPGSYGLAHSSLYRNPPMGPQDQPDYINAVASMLTTLAPEALLDELQAIELDHGRVREGEHWGPRTLDLDLLLYGDNVITTDRLTVPHPGLHQRAFVLYPLAEVAPDLDIPGRGALQTLLAACPAGEMERIRQPLAE